MDVLGQTVGLAILHLVSLRLLGHRNVALALDGVAGAALPAQRHEGQVLGQDDLDIAVVVLAPGARHVPALRQLRAGPRLGGKRRVTLEVGDHGLGGGLPFGRNLREHPAGGGEGDQHEHDQDFHGEAPSVTTRPSSVGAFVLHQIVGAQLGGVARLQVARLHGRDQPVMRRVLE